MAACDATDREEIQQFVSCIFENWFGLQAAISHGMGGNPQQSSMKVSQMTEIITNQCCSSETDKEDLSDTLEDLADEFFNTEFEDGSINEIATVLWNHKQDWFLGNKESIRSYVAAKHEKNSKILIQKLDDFESEMDTDEQTTENSSASKVTNSPTQSTEDPNGWTIPKHTRRRNR